MNPIRKPGRQASPGGKHAAAVEPQEPDRDRRQPYAKEHEEYSGDGVVRPPEEKTGKRDESPPPRKP